MATMVGAVIGTPQVHEPRAGDRRCRRSAVRYLLARLRALRDARRASAVRRRDGRRAAQDARDSGGEAGLRVPAGGSAFPGPGRGPRPREAAGRSVRQHRAVRRGDRRSDDRCRTAAAPPAPAGTTHHLPRPRTQFIGREREIADCVRLLDDTRLLTLTGIGGGGKTRLAIRIAEETVSSHPDGVWFVDLAPVTDAGRVLETIAGAFGVRESPDKDLRSSVRDHVSRPPAAAGPRQLRARARRGRRRRRRPPRGGRRRAITGHQPRGSGGRRRAAVRGPLAAGTSAGRARHARGRGIPRRAALHGSCATDCAGLRTDRRQRGGGRRHLPPARRHSAGAGAGRGAGEAAVGRADSQPAGRSLPAADRRQDRTAATADAAGGDSVELRPARRRRAAIAPRVVGLRRRLDARDRGAGVRQTTPTSSRRSTCCRGWWTSRW